MKHAKPTMRARLRGTLLLGSVLLLTTNNQAAFAAPECVGGVIMNLCKRCTTKVERSTKQDTACSSSLNVSAYGSDLALVGSSVAKQAQHGHVQLDNQYSWTYTPAKGYVGTDTFSIEWDIIAHGKHLFVVYAEQRMTVHP